MWLLSAKTARLEFFSGPDDIRLRKDGGYVILSHVWQEKEQIFQDIIALSSHTPTSDDDTPRSRASPKIRECCKLAAAHGYCWVWIDTCCINKESSAELSEAINSMFEWYRKAAVCYVYLFDVPVDNLEMDSRPVFYESKWFRRGWTLQELIAPRAVLFLLSDWTAFGTKKSLVSHLNRITSIDEDILLHRRELGKVSVSTRMSWASRRETTRVEDEAYCLMGIFGVHMPTIYGEGRDAFHRLQEEIMKISPDQTLFAWDFVYRYSRPSLEGVLTLWSRTRETQVVGHEDGFYLLSPEPWPFELVDKFEPIHIADAMKVAKDTCMRLASSGVLQFEVKTTTSSSSDTAVAKQSINEFTVTSRGMRSTLPVIKIWKIVENQGNFGGNGDRDEECRLDNHLSIAVLGCKDNETGDVLGLLLHPLSFELLPQLRHQGDSGIYGTGFQPPDILTTFKLVNLNPKSILAKPVLDIAKPPPVPYHGYMTWDTIYITHRPLPHMIRDTKRSLWERVSRYDKVAFRFSKWSLTELERHGFRPPPRLPEEGKSDIELDLPETYLFGEYYGTFISDAVSDERFIVVFKRCICSTDLGNIWYLADVAFGIEQLTKLWTINPSDKHDAATSTVTASNTCRFSHFHIGRSPNWMKRFGDRHRAVELTFTLHDAVNLLTPYVCLVDVELAGDVYMSLRNKSSSPGSSDVSRSGTR